MTAQQPASRDIRWASWVIGFVGATCLGIGIWAMYFANRTKPSPVLVIVGAALLLVPVLINRLDTVALGPSRFELRLVQQIADQGAPKTARLLDHTELARLVESYWLIRGMLRDKSFEGVRIHVQDALVDQATRFAGQHEFDPGEVRSLFPKAAPPVRVLLIGLMLGDPRLVNAEILVSAIHQPAMPNEQYHALEAAGRYWTRFTYPEQVSLLAAVTSAVIPDPSDRRKKANEILALGRGMPRSRPVRRWLLRRSSS